ncbi:cobaltochelatase subunit CobN [Swaminathania salitolerans]|uniref:Cobaltochelatase subunit CobN n=1 Tax=Swaminathania salitolerans TaxID=182838 RepID=A0A511BXY3_9PROT|nr:cobaltochelatase subunit CobN [Swaminathania salitolerans]GBQ14028.1 cobaltochelatase subunit CobN [Swaminathania salitolerans LMG 21291]GEL02888.1 cobaltochelatase subunit CobN [Swaminathania salitolerans]
MHLLVRETHDLERQDIAEDLAHDPADLVLLSFSESDLLGMEDVHGPGDPSLRVATLARLGHPMSVDLYLDRTVSQARCVVVRLLGGTEYWRYGVEELRALCRERDIRLVFVTGEAHPDTALQKLSNVDEARWTRLDALFREGGARNLRCALSLMTALAGLGEDAGQTVERLPECGLYRRLVQRPDGADPAQARRALIVFYRAHLLAADLAGIDALAEALYAGGFSVDLLYVPSLRASSARAFLRGWLQESPPDIVLNATFFASGGEAGEGCVLETAGVTILQLLQPGTTRPAWENAMRGLSQSDLAMQIVLPERDGRLASAPVSFRGEAAPGLPARREPWMPGIAQIVARAQGWVTLAARTRQARRLALVVSDYPGAEGQAAHAVGLDALASVTAIASLLADNGYAVSVPEAATLPERLCRATPGTILSAAAYRAAFSTLPEAFRNRVVAAWGEPVDPVAVRVLECGSMLVAVQPGRGTHAQRKARYHDPDLPPCHDYIGFYLWLGSVRHIDAMIHLGTHGTLEWLPGKAVALSPDCAPAVLSGGLPVIYPFIVNNPGEAASAKRRLGAVTLGHMTPPVQRAGLAPEMTELERLIDEYAEADGLDRKRGGLLRRQILDRAADLGILAESGAALPDGDEAEALARLDAYLCDVKDLQIRDGLHVFGRTPPRQEALIEAIADSSAVEKALVASRLAACPASEARGLLDALDGRFVPSGPSGAPTRGRLDVLPTGRNLTTIDPRTLPTRSALLLAHKTADLLLTRHLQEEGDALRHLVLDLWGSATMRTGGEEIALAFLLMGVQPHWDATSGRISGFEIVPLAVLDRPRVAVTLRISGLFRDAFPGLVALFDQACCAVGQRDEAASWNPLVSEPGAARVFGAAPGTYGTGLEESLASGAWRDRTGLGALYLAGSEWSYGGGRDGQSDRAGFEAQLARADVLLHIQDHAETDLLDGVDTAAHEGGLAAAAASLGNAPRLWHGDTSRAGSPVLRPVAQEVARIVRGRLSNTRWIEGMKRHGYRGAAEIARGIAALAAYAATLPERLDPQIDLAFSATLADESCLAFLARHNPEALADMRARFRDLMQRGLWHPRSNDAAFLLDSCASQPEGTPGSAPP